MREAFYGHGYTVYTASDGIEACKILSMRSVDLIISDIKMQRMDGIKLHHWVRKLRKDARTKFVFLTGYADDYSDALPISPEHDFILDKVTALEEILRFVDRLLFGKYADVWMGANYRNVG